MTREEEDDLAKRTHGWLVRVMVYMDRVHREQVEPHPSPSPRETCLQGLLLRAVMWLRTMAKLEETSDLQALAVGTRSLVEAAVDMLLIHEDKEAASSDSLMTVWEKSAKLKAATELVKHFQSSNKELPSDYKTQIDFLNNEGAAIKKERMKFWNNKKHRERWTGRNLLEDCKAVDNHHSDWLVNVFGATLTEFYQTDLRWINWYVHGSSLAGFRVSAETLTRLRAKCYEVSAHLGMICAHVIQVDYRLFELFPERQTEWEWLLNHRDLE